MALTVRRGFTLVELMIAIVIFSIGIMGVYALIQTSIATSARARDEATAANLVRERLELSHWLRDANWNTEQVWSGATADFLNGKDISENSPQSLAHFGSGYWILENDFSKDVFSVLRLRKITLTSENPEKVVADTTTKLWIDASGRFVYATDPTGLIATPWHSYVRVEPIEYPAGTAREALRVTSIAVRKDKIPKEWRATTILTNWKR